MTREEAIKAIRELPLHDDWNSQRAHLRRLYQSMRTMRDAMLVLLDDDQSDPKPAGKAGET